MIIPTLQQVIKAATDGRDRRWLPKTPNRKDSPLAYKTIDLILSQRNATIYKICPGCGSESTNINEHGLWTMICGSVVFFGNDQIKMYETTKTCKVIAKAKEK